MCVIKVVLGRVGVSYFFWVEKAKNGKYIGKGNWRACRKSVKHLGLLGFFLEKLSLWDCLLICDYWFIEIVARSLWMQVWMHVSHFLPNHVNLLLFYFIASSYFWFGIFNWLESVWISNKFGVLIVSNLFFFTHTSCMYMYIYWYVR